jgi:photosystem II stability/assembly factor-like uncharacterized protein
MKVFTRKKAVAVGYVAAFVAAMAGIGAVSRSTAVVPAVPLPFLTWYWALTVSSSDPNVLVLGTSNGLYRSSDGGKTWRSTGPTGVITTSLVQVGSSILAGGVPGTPGAAPWVRKGSARAAPDGAGVLETSTDGGETWNELHPTGLPSVSVQVLAVDPKSKALYALLNNGRLYRSTDSARSFELLSSKLGVPPWALAITQSGHFVAGDMDSGSYLSANGKAWKRAPFIDSKGGRMVMEYAVQPTDSTRVLMTSRGVQMSTDGGKSWHFALKSNVMFGPVAWSPSTAGVAYVIGFDQSVWRSSDAGKSWRQIS